jgi:hypothetical protein
MVLHQATLIIWGEHCTVHFVLSTLRHIVVAVVFVAAVVVVAAAAVVAFVAVVVVVVPKGTKDKVYSGVVFPNNKCCLMMAHVWPKHVAMTSNVHNE